MPLIAKPAEAINVFYSYADEDEELRQKLDKQLSYLKRQGFVAAWHRRKIVAGQELNSEINKYLDAAHIILILVSDDFMASDYCWSVELTRAMERHEAGEACVIPIILRPVGYKGAPFEHLQVLPVNGKAVTSWSNLEEAFLDVAEGIRDVITELLKKRLLEEANRHYDLKHYEEAKVAYDQVNQLDPDDLTAHKGKGDIFFELEHYGEALDAYEQAIRLEPNNAAFLHKKGNILRQLYRDEAALLVFEQIIQLNPNDAEAFYQKGLILN